MALGYLDDSKLYAIASAIRAKTGDSSTMTVDDMPDEIGSISTGAQVEPLSVTENGTYSAPTGYAYSPVTVNVSGGGGNVIDEVAMRTLASAAGSVSMIGSFAFAGCSSLSTVSFPQCKTIEFYGFSRAGLKSAYFPECETISSYAFVQCQSLETADFPKCLQMGRYAFSLCTSLRTVSFPSCTSIQSHAFEGCSKLESAVFPECSQVGSSAFYALSTLSMASFPKCNSVWNVAFSSCQKLETAYFPECLNVAANAFQGCMSLQVAHFEKCTSFANLAFSNCWRLVELRLDSVSAVPSIQAYTFISTPLSNHSRTAGRWGSIYVPASLYDAFLTASFWSQMSGTFISV